MDDEREEYVRQSKIVSEREEKLALMLEYHNTVRGHAYRRDPVLAKYLTRIDDDRAKLQKYKDELERKCFVQDSDLHLLAQTRAGANNDAVAKMVIPICNTHVSLRPLLYSNTFKDASTINSLLKSSLISPDLKFEIIRNVNSVVLPDMTEAFFSYMTQGLYDHCVLCLDTRRIKLDPHLMMSVAKSLCLRLIWRCLKHKVDLRGYFLMAFLVSVHQKRQEAAEEAERAADEAISPTTIHLLADQGMVPPRTPLSNTSVNKSSASFAESPLATSTHYTQYETRRLLFFITPNREDEAGRRRRLGFPTDLATEHSVRLGIPKGKAGDDYHASYNLDRATFNGRNSFEVEVNYLYALEPTEVEGQGTCFFGWRLEDCDEDAIPGKDEPGKSWGITLKPVQLGDEVHLRAVRWHAGVASEMATPTLRTVCKMHKSRVLQVCCILDMPLRVIELYVENVFWGVVFIEMPNVEPLFPVVALTPLRTAVLRKFEGRQLVAITDRPRLSKHPVQDTLLETGAHLFVKYSKTVHQSAAIPKALEKHIVVFKDCPPEYLAFNKTSQVTAMPPLHFLLYMGCRFPAEIIAEGKNLVLEGKDSLGMLPLVLAASMGHVRVVKILIERGADVTGVSSSGLSVLAGAVIGGSLATILVVLGAIKRLPDALIKKAIDYCVPFTKDSLILSALKCGMFEIIPNLVALDADCSVVNLRGNSALTFCCMCSDVHEAVCLEVLKSRTCTPECLNQKDGSKGRFSALHHAAKRGMYTVVITLLQNGANPSIRSLDGDVPLSIAIKNKEERIALKLLEETDDVSLDVKDRRGDTPLLLASSYGMLPLVNSILQRFSLASLSSNKAGTNSLMAALMNEHIDIAERLCSAPINVNSVDGKGWSALSRAAAAGFTSVVESLLDLGADAALKNKENKSPLLLAMYGQKEDAALAILESAHSQLNLKEKVGNHTLVDFSLHQEMQRVYDLLQQLGCPGNTKLVRALSEQRSKKAKKSVREKSFRIVRSEYQRLAVFKMETDTGDLFLEPIVHSDITCSSEIHYFIAAASRLDVTFRQRRSMSHQEEHVPPELLVVLSAAVVLSGEVGYAIPLGTEEQVMDHMKWSWHIEFRSPSEAYWTLRSLAVNPSCTDNDSVVSLFEKVLHAAGNPKCSPAQLLNYSFPPMCDLVLRGDDRRLPNCPVVPQSRSRSSSFSPMNAPKMPQEDAADIAAGAVESLLGTVMKSHFPKPPEGKRRARGASKRDAVSPFLLTKVKEEMPLGEILTSNNEVLTNLFPLMVKDPVPLTQYILTNQQTLLQEKTQNDLGMQALHIACTIGCYTTVRILLSCHVNVNAPGVDGVTPLMLAIVNRLPRIVRLLLDHEGIDVTLVTKRATHSALTLALLEMPDEVHKILDLDPPLTIPGNGQYPLTIALTRHLGEKIISRLMPSVIPLSSTYCFSFDCCDVGAYDVLETIFKLTGVPAVTANQNCLFLYLLRNMPSDPSVHSKIARVCRLNLMHTVSLVGAFRASDGSTALHFVCRKQALRVLDILASAIGKDLNPMERDDEKRVPLDCLSPTQDLDKSSGAVRLLRKTDLRKSRRWLLDNHTSLGTRCFVSMMFKLIDAQFLSPEQDCIDLINLFWLGFIVQMWFAHGDDGVHLISLYEKLPPMCFKLADPVIAVLFCTLTASQMPFTANTEAPKNPARLPVIERQKRKQVQQHRNSLQSNPKEVLLAVFLAALFTPLKVDHEVNFDVIVELLGRFGHAKLV